MDQVGLTFDVLADFPVIGPMVCARDSWLTPAWVQRWTRRHSRPGFDVRLDAPGAQRQPDRRARAGQRGGRPAGDPDGRPGRRDTRGPAQCRRAGTPPRRRPSTRPGQRRRWNPPPWRKWMPPDTVPPPASTVVAMAGRLATRPPCGQTHQFPGATGDLPFRKAITRPCTGQECRQAATRSRPVVAAKNGPELGGARLTWREG
jgi:hypothetical protein